MKIRFITGVAGARFDSAPGDEPDLRVDIAREFIRAGQALPVREDGTVETATSAAADLRETAARGVRRARRVLKDLVS